MRVLFLSVKDLEKSEYLREGNKNLLKTEIGICDTIALCGRLISARHTEYGPRLWINDNDTIAVTVGTFNKDVRRDAEKILREFKHGDEKYILIYGNPYETDRLYINVNHPNGVLLVSRETFERFHSIRKSAREHLLKKSGVAKVESIKEKKPTKIKEFSDQEIIGLIKSKDSGSGIPIDEILKTIPQPSRDSVESRIYELLDSGVLFEPRAGIVKVIE